MNTTAYINSFSGKEISSFATIINASLGDKYIDSDHKTVVPVSSTVTANLGELLALKYTILAICEPTDEVDLTIKTSNAYIYGMFQIKDSSWLNEAQVNHELISEVRDMLLSFKSFSVEIEKKSKKMKEVKSLARSIVSQKHGVA